MFIKIRYMDLVSLLIGLFVGAAIAAVATVLIRRMVLRGKANEIIESAKIEAEKIKNEKILQAKEKYLSLKAEHEKQVNERNAQLRDAESRIRQKENTVNQKLSELDKKLHEAEAMKASLKAREEALELKMKEYEDLRAEANRQIESIAGMSATEAKNILIIGHT